MVINNDGCHLCRREIGISQPSNKSEMVVSAKGAVQQPLAPARRQKDDGLSQIDDSHAPTVVKPPTVSHCCRN